MADIATVIANLGGIRAIGGRELTPMTESEVVAIEAQIGASLPDAYRQYLATYGGSKFHGKSADNPFIEFRPLTPLPAHFTSRVGPFGLFYGTKTHERDGHSLQVRINYYKGRMPDGIIPIGDDGIAGQICLGIKGAAAGKIYYWEQRNEPPDEEDYREEYGVPRPREVIYQNVYLIAESFEDFLSRLECAPDE